MQHVYRLRESYRVDRRYAFPSWDSTTARTPEPRPFQGFDDGAVPPNCAMPSALPMSSWTGAGNALKSRFEDPTQCKGFSPEAERVALEQYSTSGICMQGNTGTGGGNSVGEQDPRVRCSPLARIIWTSPTSLEAGRGA